MYSIVNRPVLSPTQHSLVASANIVEEPDDRWHGGLTFVPYGCDTPTLVAVDCPQAEGNLSDTIVCVEDVLYMPYTATTYVRRPAGSYDFDMVSEIAIELLSNNVSPVIASRLVYGDSGETTNPYVAEDAVDLSTPVNPVEALGALQNVLGQYGTHATIYMNPHAAAALEKQLVVADNGILYTKARGDCVVVEGTIGSFTPDGDEVDSGETYIFAHLGKPDLRMSDVEVFEGIDHATNDRYVRATQTVVATFEPCLTVAACMNIGAYGS